MKLDRVFFSSFLNRVSLKGDVRNLQLLLDFQKDCIKCLTTSEDKGTLVRSTFQGEFDVLGKVGIANLDHFRKTLDTHTDTSVDILLQKNKLVIKDTELKSSTIVIKEEYIKNTFDESKFDTIKSENKGIKISLTPPQIQKIVKWFGLNASSKRDENTITFAVKQDNILNVHFKSDSENSLEGDLQLQTPTESCRFDMGNVFIEVLSSLLTASIDLYVGPNAVVIEVEGSMIYTEFIVGMVA